MSSPTPEPSWIEHIDMVQASIVLLLGMLGWFMQRTVAGFEKTINVLFKKYEGLEGDHEKLRSDFDTLRGEHIAHHDGGRRGYDPEKRHV